MSNLRRKRRPRVAPKTEEQARTSSKISGDHLGFATSFGVVAITVMCLALAALSDVPVALAVVTATLAAGVGLMVLIAVAVVEAGCEDLLPVLAAGIWILLLAFLVSLTSAITLHLVNHPGMDKLFPHS